MSRVYLGIGSNVDPQRHIREGVATLRAVFGPLVLSDVFESEAIGFEGDPFLNLVAVVETNICVGDLQRLLRGIEAEFGRMPLQSRFSPRSLDVDILMVDDLAGDIEGVVLPRAEILENAFVLWPLSEMAPEMLHPVVRQSFAELWSAFDKQQTIRRITLDSPL
jgi:2-amino-4-hydroxy-6-hydroxymethyldihydropteridine diphosphokinase